MQFSKIIKKRSLNFSKREKKSQDNIYCLITLCKVVFKIPSDLLYIVYNFSIKATLRTGQKPILETFTNSYLSQAGNRLINGLTFVRQWQLFPVRWLKNHLFMFQSYVNYFQNSHLW